MADNSREEEKRRKREAKEQIKALKKQKKDNKKEINRIKEESGQSRPGVGMVVVMVLVFILILLLLIKLDVGGFGSKVLAPVIADVPYVNQILPEGCAKEPVIEVKKKEETTTEKKKATTEATTTQRATSTQAPATEAQKDKELAEGAGTDNSYSNDSEESGSKSSNPELSDTMQMYVDTYSSMDAARAAAILEGMAGDYPLVAEILSNMDASTRANILSAMSTNNAAKIMKYME